MMGRGRSETRSYGGDLPHPSLQKSCRHCRQTKPANEFPKNNKVRDGLSSWCRKCHNKAVREFNARKRAAKGISE